MTDWILAVEWTQIADIATAVVVVVLVLAEYKRTLPGFFSGLGEGHRRFLMLVAGGVLILKLISIRFDAVLNVNILFASTLPLTRSCSSASELFLSIQTSNGFDPTGIKRPWACISFIRGTSLRLDAW